MKNYFVQTLVKVNSTDYGWKDRASEGDLYSLYSGIQQQSYKSFKHFMQGDWEYKLLETKVNNVLEVFRFNFESIYELAHKEPCNIFFCGLDCQMVKPTEVFGKYKYFQMFNHTDPKKNSFFNDFFNCDTRYYPAELDESIWQFSLDESKDLTIWEQEQNVYNHMMWNQGLNLEDVLDPAMAFQAQWMPSPDHGVEESAAWNGIHINDCNIIHWHSSRGAPNRLQVMTEVNRRLGVPD
jgi:hypothetical protein